jgi:hypothetical protein
MLWNILEQVDVPVTQADFLEAISNVNRSVGGGIHGAYAEGLGEQHGDFTKILGFLEPIITNH